jgi:hypothetical protein
MVQKANSEPLYPTSTLKIPQCKPESLLEKATLTEQVKGKVHPITKRALVVASFLLNTPQSQIVNEAIIQKLELVYEDLATNHHDLDNIFKNEVKSYAKFWGRI